MPLAVPTLTLADNGDDTGAQATVAGATAGTTNTVYAAPWAGGLVPAAFDSYGSRAGNGTVDLTLAAGYWWIYVLSTLAGESEISLVQGLRVTTGDDAIHWQCLDGIAEKLRALTLPAPWLADTIIVRKFPWNRGLLSAGIDAGIFVTPVADRIEYATNLSDDFGLGVQVTAAIVGNQDLTSNLAEQLLNRQQIIGGLLPVAGQAALPGVPDVYDVRIEPGPVIDPGAFERQYDVSAVVVRCLNRRQRGAV